MAAIDIIMISMTIGMPIAALAPGSLRSLREEAEDHDQRDTDEEQERRRFRGGLQRLAVAFSAFGAGISPAFSRA